MQLALSKVSISFVKGIGKWYQYKLVTSNHKENIVL